MSDVTKAGDTFYTNEMVDNVLVSRDGFCDAGTKVYAARSRPQGPAALARLRRHGGLPADDPDERHARPPALEHGARPPQAPPGRRRGRSLQVYEGQSHAHYLRDDTAPETKEVFAEIAAFFDKHMKK